MKIEVNKDLCLACGACEAMCPEIFKVEDAASVIVDSIKEENIEEVKDVMAGCPTGAIVEISEEEK